MVRLRTVYCLATLLPEAAPFHAISWEPVYAGTLVTRASWPKIPDGRRRVLRESQEVPRRVAEGTYRAARKADGAWQLSSCPRLAGGRKGRGFLASSAGRTDVFCSIPKVNFLPGQLAFPSLSAPPCLYRSK